jgi:type I restriction enzyme, S subunit
MKPSCGPGLSETGMKHSRVASAYSVLTVCIGATLGKVNKTTRPVCFNQQINSLTPFMDGLSDYLALALRSSGFQELAWSKAGTGTLPIISKGKWEVLPIPLPPLAEQHRIVAKVDELVALCDRLEASLATAEDTRHHLLDALLADALEYRVAPAIQAA